MTSSNQALELATLLLTVQVSQSSLRAAFDFLMSELQKQEKNLQIRLQFARQTTDLAYVQQLEKELGKIVSQTRTLQGEMNTLGPAIVAAFAAISSAKKFSAVLDELIEKSGKLEERFAHVTHVSLAQGRGGEAFTAQLREIAKQIARDMPMELEKAEDIVFQTANQNMEASAEQIKAVIKQSLGVAYAAGNPDDLDLNEMNMGLRMNLAAQKNPMFAEEAESLFRRTENRLKRQIPGVFAGAVTPQEEARRMAELGEKGLQQRINETTRWRQSLTDSHNAAVGLARAFQQAFGGPIKDLSILWNRFLTWLYSTLEKIVKVFKSPFWGPIISSGTILIGVVLTLIVVFTSLTTVYMILSSVAAAKLISSFVESAKAVITAIPKIISYAISLWGVVKAQLGVMMSNPFTMALAAIAIAGIAAMVTGIGVYIAHLNDAADAQEKLTEGQRLPEPYMRSGSFSGFKEYYENFFKTAFLQSGAAKGRTIEQQQLDRLDEIRDAAHNIDERMGNPKNNHKPEVVLR